MKKINNSFLEKLKIFFLLFKDWYISLFKLDFDLLLFYTMRIIIGTINFLILNRIFRKEILPAFKFFIRSRVITTPYGTFYCRAQKEDIEIIHPTSQINLEKYFNILKGNFIDVGAHIGKYSIMVAKKLKSRGKVIAIEPDPENFKILKKILL